MRHTQGLVYLGVLASLLLGACAPTASWVDVRAPLTPGEDTALHDALRGTEWRFSRSQDSFTDAERRSLIVDAFASPSDIYDDASLRVRCSLKGPDQAELDLYVVAGKYLSTNSITADYRLDDAPAIQGRRWIPSTDGDAAFANNPDVQSLFIGMQMASTLQVRLYDYRGSSYSYSFDVKGFGTVYKLLRCQPTS